MSCDVEDYFQVSAFEGTVSRDSWDDMECRVQRNIERILALFDDAGATATFFTLAWIAQRFPALIRQVSDAGHEVASHGMRHIRVSSQTADAFRADVTESKAILEDVTGSPVNGYRAASWSIDATTPWAHEVLADAGYRYSSSIFPVTHDHYGTPTAPRVPFVEATSGILEVPATTSNVFGRNLPAAGGGYFRLFPYALSRWLMDRALRQLGETPLVFYFHPWELDPEQPRIAGITSKARFRHYVNLDRFERRLARLLGERQWSRMDAIYLNDAGAAGE